MDKVVKPDRLSLDPESPQACTQWKYWIKTLENYFEALTEIRGEGPAASKLRILISLVDFKVFDFSEDCDTYEDAIDKLKNTYAKAPNIIFARRILATAQQKPGQSLGEFLYNLQSLSRDYHFRAVTGKEYQQEIVCNFFYQRIDIYLHSPTSLRESRAGFTNSICSS